MRTLSSLLLTSSALGLFLAPSLSLATVFDLKVSYHGAYDSAVANKAAIEANLTNLADGVYEMTNGAHKIGKVTIYTDGAFKDNTDVLWVPSCWPNAHIGGRGNAGQRIEHCDTFPNGGSPISFLERTRSGGYTAVHEWGHFTYSLYDEYQNSDNACGTDPGSPCANDVGIQNAVMNSHWNAIGDNESVGDLSWLNFSTALNNSAATNAQYRMYQASGWETLVRDVTQDPVAVKGQRKFYADLLQVAPAAGQAPGIEINTEAGQQAARASLSFEWRRGSEAVTPPPADNSGGGAEGDAAASSLDSRLGARDGGAEKIGMVKLLVIDTSSSIPAALLADVKAAAQQLVDTAESGDVIGVIAFDGTTHVVMQPALMDSEAARDQLLAALEGLTPGTSSPILGSGLQAALSAYQAANASGEFAASVYLFADGFNAGGPALSAVTDSLRAAGLSVYAFGTGQAASSVHALTMLAENTGGEFYRIENGNELMDALEQADMDASPTVDVLIANGSKTVSGSLDIPFYVDSTLSELDLSFGYDGAPGAVAFQAVTPQGAVVPLNPAAFCGDVQEEDTTYCSLQVNRLPEGAYILRAIGNSPRVFYALSGLPADNDTVFFASLHSAYGDTIEPGASIVVEAQAGSNFPITGLSVSGEVEMPDGSVAPVVFKDDGTAPDQVAGDGVYTAAAQATQEGEYLFTALLDNLAGTGQMSNKSAAFAPGPTGNLAEMTLTPVTTKFQRAAQAEVWVEPASADYQRVMDWAESQFPQVLPAQNVHEQTIGVYHARHYPGTGTYVGYNPTDGMFYLYTPGRDSAPKVVGSLSQFLPLAEQAGF